MLTKPTETNFDPRFRHGRLNYLKKELVKNRYVYIMLLPVVIYYIVIHYFPMYGIMIAFQNFNPMAGMHGSEWIGFTHFTDFFNSYYFWRLLKNTILLSFYDMLFGFPAPIILALILNEVTHMKFKRLVQTISYLPHFISIVVVAGLVINFLARDGLISTIVIFFGGEPTSFMQRPEYFRTIYVASQVWQTIGWGSIIYLAALTSIDPSLYEAAQVDGARRWHQLWHITLPGIVPVIAIMLILRTGDMMTIGFEKIILLYNPLIYETADVIPTFVYRKGLLEMNYSYSAAIGLFNAVISFILLIAVNRLAKRISGSSLW